MGGETVIEPHPLLKGQVKEAPDQCQQLLRLAGAASVANDLKEADPVCGIAELRNELRIERPIGPTCRSQIQDRYCLLSG
ncbi:hypothetical protein GCM10009589_10860 [Arthrobacter pascens]